MATAKNASVIYVIGVVRFPPVADLDKFAGAIQEALGADYPFSSNPKVTELNIQIGDKGVDVKPQEVSLWQFLNKERTSAVIVNQGLVGFHTTAYETHEVFLERLLQVFEVARSIEGNHLRFIEALALRYLDLIVPREGEELSKYLQHKLPADVGVAGLSVNEGVNVLGMKSEVGNLRLQVFLNPKTVVPTDLISPLMVESGWNWDLPKGDFVTIDTDHSAIYSPPVPVEDISVRDNMYSLRKPMGDIFRTITTPYAMNVWGLEQ